MSAPLIEEYAARLRRSLPADLAEEAAAGLTETYERHLDDGAGQEDAARNAVAEFGEAALVIGEFTRQAPGRHAARLLLATGPLVGSCWAATLITSRAWTWPAPGGARLAIGAVLLATVLALAAAATSRRGCQRTRLAAPACLIILAVDAAAITAVASAAPTLTWPLEAAVAVSLARMLATVRTLPQLAGR